MVQDKMRHARSILPLIIMWHTSNDHRVVSDNSLQGNCKNDYSIVKMILTTMLLHIMINTSAL